LESANFVIQEVKEVLNKNRTNSRNVLKDIFIESSNMAKSLGFDIQLPRISKTQMNRANHPIQSVEDYYRWSI